MIRLVAALLFASAVAALAQEGDLPSLRDARDMVFSEDGAVSWEVIDNAALTEADRATLDQINQIQPQPYYGALAMAPEAGLASDFTTLAANYHDEDNARAAALDACDANRGEEGAPCIIALVIRPDGWEAGRELQLSAEATAALSNEYRALPRRSRVLAISPATGRWGVGEGREAAFEACGVEDCVAVVEG